ncbi:hypothetical protein QVD17_04480 [Tagetes erecta]|uniref:Cytochrome P450 n=1 Tax=Tagetes erecta TaxID=13708 RepID=A0AAD8LJM5_TARER|nr:hypothetical protein QVD17_04480 [Tagetes erecta]
MELFFLIIASIVVSILINHGIRLHRKSKLPPGPVGFPIIGNLLELGPKPHEDLAKLAQKYGPLMTIQLGSNTIVVATTPDAAKEVLQRKDEACSGRLAPDALNAMKNPEAAMLWMSPANDTWRAIRKALNMYLTNQTKLETLSGLRHEVVNGVVEFIRESGRKKVDVDIGQLALAVGLNQLSNTFLSQNVTNYEEHDNIGDFKHSIETVMEMLGKFNIADIFPVLKPLDPQNIRGRAKVAYDWLDEVIEGLVSKRLKHRESKLPRFGDMLDSLLEYSQANEDKFTLVHIKALLVDLFIAGTDTASNTVTWIMTELLLNRDVLLKVREEVSQVVGKDGKIEEAKILGLTYLHAVINETMRLHTPVPLLVPHTTETEVKLGNYIVPPRTQVIINMWALARDPTFWENPTSFKPERFLTNGIDYKGQNFEFLPFGSGRRRCPGMPLGHRMVSLLVASFVYHFDWKLPHGKQEIDKKEVFGLSLQKAVPLLVTPIPLK